MSAKEKLIVALRSDFDGLLAMGGPEHVVPVDQILERFLDSLKIPRWDQKLMYGNRIVTVKRTASDGTVTSLPGTGRSFQLVRNDRVTIDRAHAPYKAQRDQMIAESKDYVLVAGSDDDDPFIVESADLMTLRRGMIRIDHVDAGPEGSLQQMIRAIGEAEGPEVRPLNDLHIVSHAWHTGELLFAATEQNDRAISWESLEAAGAALKLPDEHIFNRADPPKLIVYSCEFARAEPVMKRLRELMNPRLRVYAPRHFVGANRLVRDAAYLDYFQFMCKPAFVHSPVELSRDQIIQDLVDRGVTDANDVVIDAARWRELVPTIPSGPESPEEGWFEEQLLPFKLPARNVPGRVLPALEVTEADEFPIGGMYRWPVLEQGVLTTTKTRAQFDADPIGALKAAVAAIADPRNRWYATHRYPIWKRLQFDSADLLINNLSWTAPNGELRYLDGQNKIQAKGWGVKYCVMIPVQEPAAASVPHGKRALRVSYYAEGSPTPHPDDLALTSGFWQTIG
jgi:hypothetical protein